VVKTGDPMSSENWCVVPEAAAMQALARDWRSRGLSICLVPTMGALHQGHIALVREARRRADRVVVSIFVNPTQFGPNEDFSRYPRDLDGDMGLLSEVGVDAIFHPTPAVMYPDGFQTKVELTRLPAHLCGLTRTNHFAGVAQVVLKLFNICMPDSAVFGQKDFQQVRIIEQMVADLNVDVEIVRHPIVREPDGLAMSSRNIYLTPGQRKDAVVINRTLAAVDEAIQGGAHDSAALVRVAVDAISAGGGQVEYFNVCDPATLDDVADVRACGAAEVLLVTAVRFGSTRLIDNRLVAVAR